MTDRDSIPRDIARRLRTPHNLIGYVGTAAALAAVQQPDQRTALAALAAACILTSAAARTLANGHDANA